MTGSTGPLEHYPSPPGPIRAAADRAEQACHEYANLVDDLSEAARRASFQVDGDLTSPTEQVAKKEAGQAAELSKAAMLAAGVMDTWAGDIEDYNHSIDALNAQWEADVRSHFGVESWAYQDANRTARQNDDANHEAVSSARRSALLGLQRAQDGLLDRLEERGDEAATALDQGPTTSNLARYARRLLAMDYLSATVDNTGAFTFLRDLTVGVAPDLARSLDEWLKNERSIGVLTKALQNPKLLKAFGNALDEGITDGMSMVDRWSNGLYDTVMRRQRFADLLDTIRDSVRPGPLISETAPLVGDFVKTMGESENAVLKGLSVANDTVGRYLGPVALGTGLWGLGGDWVHRHSMSTEDKVVDSLSNGGSAIAGGVGTLLLVGAPLGAGLVLFGGVAGVVALGATAVKYRRQIAGAVGGAAKLGSRLEAAAVHQVADSVRAEGQAADAVVSGAGRAADRLAHGIGDQAEAEANAAGAVLDHVDPRLGNAARDAGKVTSHAVAEAGDLTRRTAADVGHGIDHASDAVAHGLDHAGDDIGHAGKAIGNAIGGLFG